jgi:thiol-disulfide isomerase/thioredoxin
MKEIIHFTITGSTVCEEMAPVIADLINNNADIKYTKINIDEDRQLFDYYGKKYSLTHCPAFLGLVDGNVQDGHLGSGTRLILESLVN